MSEQFGAHCCHCTSTVGDAAKRQPTFDPDDPGKVWCPRCFVWHRCRMESTPLGADPKGPSESRFQAHQMAAAKCQFCAWETVCFGSIPGLPPRCGHCGKNGAILLPIDDKAMIAMLESLKGAARDAAKAMT